MKKYRFSITLLFGAMFLTLSMSSCAGMGGLFPYGNSSGYYGNGMLYQGFPYHFDFSNVGTSSGTVMPAVGSSSTTTTTTRTPQQSSGSTLRSCRVCAGIGKCWTCNGNRYYTKNGKTFTCPNCTNGLCTTCGGTGKVR